ncbi:LuxR C-terminal-related transcriptional regulator [Amycolatopsis sp. OK19-0408]|uniref:LuxR C-terminal-related transcriptional regulator n=1 Tax=Amycolatopsis iheyensis TaxID=2945988 RepID=A0A9X2NNH8_9PSEU|nr:LuxR C-terminal-related transcriptional regulator [Amycolatopsis iheyensis]MCR6488265.1 LuxR C-terminal-related transcriptional regulator [Amycolatopsis iheyensis]
MAEDDVDAAHIAVGSDASTDERFGDVPAAVADTQMTSFIGRSDLIARAKHRLSSARLITLLGLGGVGKSRLLLRLAAEPDVQKAYPDRVWVVRLVDVPARGDLVAAACADQLGLMDNADGSPVARLRDFFRDRRALLMLDNCEHLTEGALGEGQVSRLLSALLPAAPNLTVVATSRVKLGVAGEHLLHIEPLSSADALCLLRDRAQAAGRTITNAELPLAERLCEMLGGLPLAVELAAGQLDVMTLAEIVDHPELLRLLVDGLSEQRHHRTMYATIKWSYDLLNEPEQRLLATVSVFEGGFDLDAAVAVGPEAGIDASQVPALLRSLVRKSLLLAEATGDRTRYRMLELIRQFGLQLVSDADKECELRSAHARYIVRFASRVRERWFGSQETTLLLGMRAELPNSRAAQEFLLSSANTAEEGLQLPVDITASRAFVFAGVLADCLRMLTRGLEKQHQDTPTIVQLTALCQIAWIAQIQGSDSAGPALAAAEQLARRLGCEDSFGPLLYAQGCRLWLAEPDQDRARGSIALLAQAEAAFERSGDQGNKFMAELYGAMATVFLGSADAAFAASAKVLETATAARAQWCISWAKWTCGLTELLHGNLQTAIRLAQEALRLQLAIKDRFGPPWSLWLIALILLRLGKFKQGAWLLGGARVAQRLTQTNVLGLSQFLRVQRDVKSYARQRFGDRFDEELRVGEDRAASIEEVYASAAKKFDTEDEGSAVPRPADRLTGRELQIAKLVSEPMSNEEIAERLGISHRTVEKHVQRILAKYGLSTRTDIAVWYLRTVAPSEA